MKRLICILLVLLITSSTLVCVSAKPAEEELTVKAYSAYNESANIEISTTVDGKTIETVTSKGTSAAPWLKDGLSVTSTTGKSVTTVNYTNCFTDSSLNIGLEPGVDTLLIYVEYPTYRADEAGMSLLDIVVSQNGKSASIATAGSYVSYMSVFDGTWQTAIIGRDSEINALGVGFEGYVKVDLKKLSGFKEAAKTIDFSKEYSISTLKIGYNHVGGENGSFVVGGYYSVLSDSDSYYMVNADTNETICIKAIGGDFDCNGKLDKEDIKIAKEAAVNPANVNLAALQRADILGDKTDISADDFVNLVKQVNGNKLNKVNATFNPSTAEKDIELCDNNQDRGFRMQVMIDLTKTSKEKLTQDFYWFDEYKKGADSVRNGMWVDPNIALVYFKLTKWSHTETLPKEVFDRMQIAFDCAEELGLRLIVRFLYQESTGVDPKTKLPYYEEQMPKQETMFSHMKQLKPILEKNKDIMYGVEAGFMGAYAEWHGYADNFYDASNYINGVRKTGEFSAKLLWEHTTAYDEALIIKNILDMVPEELPVFLRRSEYRELFLEQYPDEKYAERLGLHNDAFFGYVDEPAAEPYVTMDHPTSVSAHLATNSVPSGGECFWGALWSDPDTGRQYARATGKSSILAYKYFHQTIFSIFHNSFEGLNVVAQGSWKYTERDGDMMIWAKTAVTEKWLAQNNVFYSPSYFKDADGNTVKRSEYEFIRDHLGYRLEAKDIELTGKISKNKNVKVTMDLVNYGFSAAYTLSSEFVILDKDNKIVSRAKAGNPSDWFNSSALETQKISSVIEMPSKSGKYKLALYVYNAKGDGAYLANDIEQKDGFNILYEFKL